MTDNMKMIKTTIWPIMWKLMIKTLHHYHFKYCTLSFNQLLNYNVKLGYNNLKIKIKNYNKLSVTGLIVWEPKVKP